LLADNHRRVIKEITHGPYQCREAGELVRCGRAAQVIGTAVRDPMQTSPDHTVAGVGARSGPSVSMLVKCIKYRYQKYRAFLIQTAMHRPGPKAAGASGK
jgi:hypothetical protein